jgi:hypothetical protein
LLEKALIKQFGLTTEVLVDPDADFVFVRRRRKSSSVDGRY